MSAIKAIWDGLGVKTQVELAELAQCNQGVVSKWLSGRYQPDLHTLLRLRKNAIKRRLPWDDKWIFAFGECHERQKPRKHPPQR